MSLSDIELFSGARFEEAIEAYNKAIEINPQYAKAWYNKGNALDELGKHEESLKALDKAKELGYTADSSPHECV